MTENGALYRFPKARSVPLKMYYICLDQSERDGPFYRVVIGVGSLIFIHKQANRSSIVNWDIAEHQGNVNLSI